VTGAERGYIEAVIASGRLFDDGPYSERCSELLQTRLGATPLLTTSGTRALELAALSLEVGEGDEIIMPSFTHVSTANAFVLRGAMPVFVDIRPDTLNIDERQLKPGITGRSRAIVVVHYGGVAAEMEEILTVAESAGLAVIEDAAEALDCRYRGHPLGALGDMGAFSFDGQKNATCGEGGALVVRQEGLLGRAQMIYDNGTDRAEFRRGQRDRYVWQRPGSSFRINEVTAAFLLAQLEGADDINARRRVLWERYWERLQGLETQGHLQLPTVPEDREHQAHMFWVILARHHNRQACLMRLNQAGVQALSHFVPLHDSPAGGRYGRVSGDLRVTKDAAARLIRLPLHPAMTFEDVDYAVGALTEALGE
jgi:dTDP-4-amino-4,6-dideoxygalactose transaminase